MRKALSGSVIVLLVVLLTFGLGLAGKGKGSGTGPGDGTSPIHNILSGDPFDITGDVVSLVPGQGLVIATATGNVTIYGVGPVWYWESLGVDRPAVGETIRVQGYIVYYDDLQRYIAMTITVGGEVEEVVELRDSLTGLPLWRGSGSLSRSSR